MQKCTHNILPGYYLLILWIFPLTLKHNTMQFVIKSSGKTPLKTFNGLYLEYKAKIGLPKTAFWVKIELLNN